MLIRFAGALRHPIATAAAVIRPKADPTQNQQMMRVVLNSARDRWQTPAMSSYTPDAIETILRGAFSGDLVMRWQLFDVMEATWPRLAKALSELKQCLMDHEWPLQPYAIRGEKPSTEAQRRRKVVEAVMWGMEPDPTAEENDFEDMLRDMADAWSKGISVQELDWESRQTTEGAIIGLRAARWIHPRNYGYPPVSGGPDRLMLRLSEISSDNPNLAAALAEMERMGQVRRHGAWVTFPENKFLIAIAKQKTGHAIGGALLQPLAWWWCVQNFSAQWLVQFAQIFGVPQRFAFYGPNAQPAQVARIEEMLEKMGSAGWGAFPAGTLIEIKEAVKSAADNPSQAVITAADMCCDLLVLGQTLTGTQGARGSQALGNVHANVLSDRKKALRTWAAGRINRQLIPMIARLNFGDTNELPFVTAGDDSEDDEKAMAETMEILARTGMRIPTSWAHERMSIPEPEDGESVLVPMRQTSPNTGANPAPVKTPPTPNADAVQAQAADTTDERYAAAVAESVTGVERKWLEGVRPFFLDLVKKAQDPKVTEEEFLQIVSAAKRRIGPELAGSINTQSLALAMERNMGGALVNGALKGWTERNS